MAILTRQRLLKWFENYDKWVHQAERAARLGIAWVQEDKLLGQTYHSVNDLDLQAESMKALLNNPEELAKNEALDRENALRIRAEILSRKARGLEV